MYTIKENEIEEYLRDSLMIHIELTLVNNMISYESHKNTSGKFPWLSLNFDESKYDEMNKTCSYVFSFPSYIYNRKTNTIEINSELYSIYDNLTYFSIQDYSNHNFLINNTDIQIHTKFEVYCTDYINETEFLNEEQIDILDYINDIEKTIQTYFLAFNNTKTFYIQDFIEYLSKTNFWKEYIDKKSLTLKNQIEILFSEYICAILKKYQHFTFRDFSF